MRALSLFSPPQLAFDVGTATTRACTQSSAILERPSLVCEDLGGATIYRRALRGGVVSDIAVAAEVAGPMVKALSSLWRRPNALVCVPSDATPFERDQLIEAISSAGARVTSVVPEPLAAAIGCGADMSSPYAQLVVDIGEGVTDVAAIADGTIVSSAADRTGCSEIRRTLLDWLRWHRRIDVDGEAADAIIRTFCNDASAARFEVRGRDVHGEEHGTRVIDRDEVATLVEPALDAISGFVAAFIGRLPNRVALEIIESGAFITGGGATFDLLVRRIEQATGISSLRPRDPLNAVIAGARAMMGGRRPTPARVAA